MSKTETTDYFRDLYELDADRSLSLAEKIERTVALGRERLDVQHGLLTFTGRGEYEVIESTITDGAYESGTVHDLETTYCRHVVGDEEVLAISDVEDSAYSDDIAADTTETQCYIGAPLTVDRETFGTLCYSGNSARERAFTEDESRFVELLARRMSRELEREKHYATLESQNERLNEFAGLLAHDIRTPLTVARGYTELVAERVPEAEAAALQTALDSLDRIEALIDDALEMARQGEDVGQREPVELGAVARTAWDTVDAAGTLLVADERTVSANRSLLEQLFESLFRNIDDRCTADVAVTVRGTDDGFSVTDDGPAVSPEIAESLFGGAVGDRRIQLDLLIAERVVSGHGWEGRVEADDETRFLFSGVGAVTSAIHEPSA
jgi:two-component system OmpR family sensor kinase